MAYVPPDYPTDIPLYTEIWPYQDDLDWMNEGCWDALVKELRAVQTELGDLPKGSFSDVAARLSSIPVISTLTEKTDLHDNDLFIIEDSEDSYAKKKVQSSNVGGGGGAAVAKTLCPRDADSAGTSTGGPTLNDNTTAYIGLETFEFEIEINNISFYVTNYVAQGTLDIAIYSEDGQTKHLEVTTPTINANGVWKATLGSPVTLPAGQYYVAVVSNDAAIDLRIRFWVHSYLTTGVTGKKKIGGTMTVAAGTLPATFDPVNDLTVDSYVGLYMRLDN